MGEVGPTYSMNEYGFTRIQQPQCYVCPKPPYWAERGLESFICSQVDSQPRPSSGRYL